MRCGRESYRYKTFIHVYNVSPSCPSPLPPSSFLHPSNISSNSLPTSCIFFHFYSTLSSVSGTHIFTCWRLSLGSWANSQWLPSPPFLSSSQLSLTPQPEVVHPEAPRWNFKLFDFWRLYVGNIFYVTILLHPVLTYSHSYGCCELRSFTAKSFLEASLSGLLLWLLHFQSMTIGLRCSSKLHGKTLPLKPLYILVVGYWGFCLELSRKFSLMGTESAKLTFGEEKTLTALPRASTTWLSLCVRPMT